MKKQYAVPQLKVHGSVVEITLHHNPGHNPPGNAFGHSCGNGNVAGPISCGEGIPVGDPNTPHN